MIKLTPAMVEAILSAPDLEAAMGVIAADMVASGWAYQEAMVAIAVAFGERLRAERLKTGAFMRAAEEGRAMVAALEPADVLQAGVSGIGDSIERAWRRKQATDPPEDLAEKARKREAVDARLDARRRGANRNA